MLDCCLCCLVFKRLKLSKKSETKLSCNTCYLKFLSLKLTLSCIMFKSLRLSKKSRACRNKMTFSNSIQLKMVKIPTVSGTQEAIKNDFF